MAWEIRGDEELAPKQEAILLTFPNSCPLSSLLRPTPEEAPIQDNRERPGAGGGLQRTVTPSGPLSP